MNIKRYNFFIVKEKDDTIIECSMIERENGEYVKVKDVDALITELYMKHGPEALKEHMEQKILEQIKNADKISNNDNREGTKL